ncbi:MAG: EamA family transporter RarD [Pseudomonadota bacterium]
MIPIYFKWLGHVPALQVIGHRILWSCLMLCAVLLFKRQWRDFLKAALQRRVIRIYLVAALLVSTNWLIFVWAVNAGFIVETSLGYFINPLISVLLGVVLLGERLRPWQWPPIVLATLGVLYLTFALGSLPWISLTLASTFAIYGLIKKTAPLGPLHGLTLETGLMLLPAVIYLIYLDGAREGAFLHTGAGYDVLLVGAGLVTAVPLLLFASAAQRIPLALLGVLQYIAPTLQFLLGVLVYQEAFTQSQLIGYGLVWVALFIFGIEGYIAHRAPPGLVEQGG